MNRYPFRQTSIVFRVSLAVLASNAILVAGCANLATTAPGIAPVSSSATLTGSIHGGNQPVAFAAVTLVYAGQNGPGSGDPGSTPVANVSKGAPIVAATTTSADDGYGSFSFTKNPLNDQPSSGNTYSCPTGTDPLVYVVARGGNTLNTHNNAINNSAAVFIAPYGTCSQLSAANFVNMSEVTTVATMAALQQYFNPVTGSFGADGIGAAKTALANSFKTVPNLVNLANGKAVTSVTIPGATFNGNDGVSAVTVTATPETAKINHLANVLAACVNNASSSASACTILFNNATPPLTAITSRPYHTAEFTTATDVLQAIYYILGNPSNGSKANLGNIYGLSAAAGAPFQPTLAAVPTDWNVAISYSSNSTCGTGSGSFIGQPYDLNVDITGNIWISNSQLAGNLSEITPNGIPVVCTFLSGGSKGGTIDNVGNIWYASNSGTSISRYTPYAKTVLTFTPAAAPLAITADGSGNIFFSTALGSLYEIAAGATATTATAPIQISTVLGLNPIRLMPDRSAAIWATSGSTFITRVAATANTAAPNYFNGFTSSQFTTPAASYGIALTPFDNVFTGSTGSNQLTFLSGSGTSYAIAAAWPTTTGQAGVSDPTVIAIDGASSVWTANHTNNGSLGSVSAITALGVSISPDGVPAGGYQKSSSYLSSNRALVIDQSGNIWVAGDGISSNYVTEIVGAAVPIYQPFAIGLSNGRFQTIP